MSDCGCGPTPSTTTLPGLDPASIAAIAAGGSVVIEQLATPQPASVPAAKAPLARPIVTEAEVTLVFRLVADTEVLADIQSEREELAVDSPGESLDVVESHFLDDLDLAGIIAQSFSEEFHGYDLKHSFAVTERVVPLATITD